MEGNQLLIKDLFSLYDQTNNPDLKDRYGRVEFRLQTFRMNYHQINMICRVLEKVKTDSLVINLENNPDINEKNVQTLLKVLKSRFTSLHTLSLFFTHTGFSDANCPQLLAFIELNVSSLKKLKIGMMGAKITDTTVTAVMSRVQTLTLEEFYFGIRSGEFEASFVDMVDLVKNIKCPSVNMNAFFVPKFPPDFSSKIGEASRENPHIKSFRINGTAASID